MIALTLLLVLLAAAACVIEYKRLRSWRLPNKSRQLPPDPEREHIERFAYQNVRRHYRRDPNLMLRPGTVLWNDIPKQREELPLFLRRIAD